MKKYFMLCGIIACLTNHVFSETKYWVGTTGTYSNGANWNSMSNGSGTAGAPVNTDNIIIDRNATITIDGTFFPSSIWVINNATVNFINNGTSKTYTIGGGTVSPAFNIANGSSLNVQGSSSIIITVVTGSTAEIYGILDFSGSSSRLDCPFGGGLTKIKNGGKIRYGGASSNTTGSTTTFQVEDGGIYEIYRDGGSFPTGTYQPNSLLLNSGAINTPSSFSMNSSTGSYGNYEFNSPSYIGNSLGLNQNLTFNNLAITDDGSGKWIYSTTPVSAYTLTINGNVTVATGATLVINNASSGSFNTKLLVKGNLTNNGLITSTAGNTGSLVEFGGNTDATIQTAPNSITNDISILMNKTASKLVALSDISLPNSANARLTLTNGNIDMQLNDKLLHIQNPAADALSAGSLNSHIIGKLKRSSNQAATYTFPVSASGTEWAKAAITTSNGNATEWTVEFIPTNTNANSGLTPGMIDVVTKYYWNISRTGTTPANAGFLELFYSGITNPGILLPAQAKVVHWDGTTWNNLGGTHGGESVTNTLGSTGGAAPGDPITTFSPFALGGVIGVIPVLIEYLNGYRNGSLHKLSWKINCNSLPGIYMHLERSADGRNFSEIHSVYADNQRCLQPFDFSDQNPLDGMNYYRLKITDIDGKVTYSNIKGLMNKINLPEVNALYPNPARQNSNITLEMFSNKSKDITLTIYDLKGRKIKSTTSQVFAGRNKLQILSPAITAGTYLLIANDTEGTLYSGSFICE